jgi:hypothetical protein
MNIVILLYSETEQETVKSEQETGAYRAREEETQSESLRDLDASDL